jgi:hypothetical protein
MGSLEAGRVAEGDRTSFWQAVIVDPSLLRGQGTSIVDLSWAGCIINTSHLI